MGSPYPMSFTLIVAVTISVTNAVSKQALDEIMRDSEDGKMDDMFDKMGSVLGELVDSLDSLKKGTCKYKCNNGNKPVPREGHVPSTNGCGSYGFELDTSSLPLMTKCCDDHDRCYDTCNSNKEKCDAKFRKCLKKMCDVMEYGFTEEDYEGCKATAEMMHTGSEMLGCNAFKKAQAGACDCGPEAALPPKPKEPITEKATKAGRARIIRQPYEQSKEEFLNQYKEEL